MGCHSMSLSRCGLNGSDVSRLISIYVPLGQMYAMLCQAALGLFGKGVQNTAHPRCDSHRTTSSVMVHLEDGNCAGTW